MTTENARGAEIKKINFKNGPPYYTYRLKLPIQTKLRLILDSVNTKRRLAQRQNARLSSGRPAFESGAPRIFDLQ